MRFSLGNKKLGPNVLNMSRPVGTTCPVSCAYHPLSPGPDKNKCYMIRMEGLRPQIRKRARENLEADALRISNHLFDHSGKLVRMHVGGDFLAEDGELDMNYILHWRSALQSLEVLPNILCFTHVYHQRLVRIFDPFAPEFQLIASVNNKIDFVRARFEGFTRFALAMEEKYYNWHGGAWVEKWGMKFLVCPAIRGKLPNCESCQYCWKTWSHGGHVAFPEHSQPNWPEIWKRKRMEAASRA